MCDNNEKMNRILVDYSLNEHLMKHHLDLKITAISMDQIKSILGLILKALDDSNDYRVIKTPTYNLTYYKIGQIQ